MQKYSVLITRDHGMFSAFKRELGRYVLTTSDLEMTLETSGRPADHRGTHEISRAETSKQPILSATLPTETGPIERYSIPDDREDSMLPVVRPVMVQAPATEGVKLVTMVEPCSHGGVVELRSHDCIASLLQS